MGRRISPDARVRELEAIYCEHHRRVRWVLRARAVADAELDDLVHETFVAIYGRLGERDASVPMGMWVAGVARNVAFSHRRSFARRRAAPTPPPPAAEVDPDEQLARRHAWDRLEEFLRELDPKQREVFVLADVMGMCMPEVATLVEAPLNTLYSRLRIARRHFRDRFGAAAEDARREAAAADAPRRAEQQHAWLLIATELVPAEGAATIGTWLGAGIARWIVVGTVLASTAGVIVALAPTSTSAPVEPTSAPIATRVSTTEAALPPAVTTADAPALGMPSSLVPTAAERERTVRRAPTGAVAAARAGEVAPADVLATADELATIVDALRAAQQQVTAGEHEVALAILDRLPASAEQSALAAELRELRRKAACGAGRPAPTGMSCPAKTP